MLLKCFLYFIGLMIVLSGYSQEKKEIKLNKHPFSGQNHILSFQINEPSQGDVLVPSLKNPKTKIGVYKAPILTQKHFKSLEVVKNKKLYDIVIKMDPKGKAVLDKSTTDISDKSIVYVFNDTVYQVRKSKTPILDGKFTVSGLSFSQKERMISYYEKLPTTALQNTFYKAIRKKQIRAADSLVKLGALVVEGKTYRNKVFVDAYERRDTLVTNFLKKHNFVSKPKNLREALEYKNLNYIKKYFLARKKMTTFQKEINETFFSEVKRNTLDVIKLLVELGANIHYKNRQGKSPINYIAAHNSCDVLTYVLDNKMKHTPVQILSETCYSNDTDVIDCLLNREGFDINLRFPTGDSVMHLIINTDIANEFARYDNELVRVLYLLDKGVNLSFIDSDGNTPLHLFAIAASSYTNNGEMRAIFRMDLAQKAVVDVAKKMIEKGADPNMKNNEGLTPLEYAKANVTNSKKRNRRYDMSADELIKYLETLK